MALRRRRPIVSAALAGLCGVLGGCKAFQVNVGTDQPIELAPIKVDVAMRVDLYQHGAEPAQAREELKNYKDVAERRRNRMAEIQELKNNRLVGENHLGLLSIRNLPAGDYGTYVKKTVDDENADRVFLMTHDAESKGEALADVQKSQWLLWQQNSFPGEWIEMEGKEAGTFEWVKKEGILSPKP